MVLQYHGCWCIGDVSNHGIKYAVYSDVCLPQWRISTGGTYALPVLRNDKKIKYVLMYPEINMAWLGLIKWQCIWKHLGGTFCRPAEETEWNIDLRFECSIQCTPIYRGCVYRGIGYIAVTCWTPFFGAQERDIFCEITVTPLAQFAGDNFSRNLLTAC